MINHPTILTMLAEAQHAADLTVAARRQRSLAPAWLRPSKERVIVNAHNLQRLLRPALHQR